MPTVAPFGSWRSPLDAVAIARGGMRFADVAIGPDGAHWIESRPSEGGRSVLVHRGPDGSVRDVTPPGFNVRTRVHEYGGGACLVAGTTAIFANFDDQRLYRQDGADDTPRPITPEPETPAAWRFADARATPDAATLICIRERHEPDDVVNEIVALPADGSAAPTTLVSGNDFYAAPRVSPDGRRLAWTTWNHPAMPWDACELWLADLVGAGPGVEVTNARRVAGGPRESAYEPLWHTDGSLLFLSDIGGWWNLQRFGVDDERPTPLLVMDADFGWPQWSFDSPAFASLPDGRVACTWSVGGLWQLGLMDSTSGELERLDVPYASFANLRSDGFTLAMIAAGPRDPDSVVVLSLDEGVPRPRVLRRALDVPLPAASIAVPEPMVFPTDGRDDAHALFYAPASEDFVGPDDELPPLLVISHGGPTGAAEPTLDPRVQFWTTRGFAVVDVNYGGSSGFGRAYRERLHGTWGIVDVADCVNAARFLASTGRVDQGRMAIRGGSAGGYTTLCALAFHDVFTAGASYFGVADLVTFTGETHKFESRYLDWLVGAYPEAADVYRERSPVHAADRISCPVIMFQGLEDKVVPPSQAEAMLGALRARGIPHAYLAFAGEQHGFRRAESIQAALEAELSFYAQVFGFEPAGEITPVVIEGQRR